MKEMKEHFVPRINEFIDLVRQTNKEQAKHIVELGNWLTHLTNEFKVLTYEMQSNELFEIAKGDLYDPKTTLYLQKSKEFEHHIRAFRAVFQQHIKDTNYQMGMFSSHWGGYIEQIGTLYLLNLLRKEYQVHTWYQKFKKYWHKSRNVEVDLLAISDQYNFVVEVKNQLKETVLEQVNAIIEKLNAHCPELGDKPIQPVIICMHAELSLLEDIDWGNIWILKYNGFEPGQQEDSWVWLRKGDLPLLS